MHITFEAGLACTLFNTARMHAPLTRWAHHDSITVWVRLTHRHACELDRHIGMLSSSCDSEIEFNIHVSWIDTSACYLHIVTLKFMLPKRRFGRRNKRWNPDFRSTFQGFEYSIWATNPWKVSRKSGFHLLFLLPKSTPPKRRFWKDVQTCQNAFSKHFSRAWVQDLGYKTLKSASKTHSDMFVRPSKIFVWGA